MSYSKELKSELCTNAKTAFKSPCCRSALLTGLLLFANTFTHEKIKSVTESESVSRLTGKLLKEFGLSPNLYEIEKKNNGEIDMSYKITVPVRRDVEALVQTLGYVSDEPLDHIKREKLICEKCGHALIMGAFLAGGFMNPPEKSYHLEITTPSNMLCCDLADYLGECGLPAKVTSRKNINLVYYKESAGIEDFLSYIGAQKSLFDLMNVKIFRDLRNNANRAANCDAANIDKVISASTLQVESIKRLIEDGRIEQLSSDLRITAQLRLEHNEATLAELASLHEPPITKSGVNHRLKKIIEFANGHQTTG